MIGKHTVQEIVSLLAVCLLGATVVAIVLFITTVAAGNYHASTSGDAATSTVQ